MTAAINMVVQAQSFRVTPPPSRVDSGESQRAEQNLREAEAGTQAAAQNTRSAQNEEQQARRNLQAAQAEEQRAGARVSAAQADLQRIAQPQPTQLTGTKVNVFI